MKFIHHPDGHIVIGDKIISLSVFIEQEPDYILPAGFIGREYDSDTGRHVLYTGHSQAAGEMPWHDGDMYMSKIQDYEIALAAVESAREASEDAASRTPAAIQEQISIRISDPVIQAIIERLAALENANALDVGQNISARAIAILTTQTVK